MRSSANLLLPSGLLLRHVPILPRRIPVSDHSSNGVSGQQRSQKRALRARHVSLQYALEPAFSSYELIGLLGIP